MTAKFDISVIIPTYNPSPETLARTMLGLQKQDLPLKNWECIIIDNGSVNNTLEQLDLGWHPNLRVVREHRQGLTYARLKGYEVSDGGLIIMVDDDNILDGNYLSTSLSLFTKMPDIGVAGGRSIGCFGKAPETWQNEFFGMIAVRPQQLPQTITVDLSKGYPAVSPIGAGMVIKRACFKYYYDYVTSSKSIITDRTKSNLSSGGDNEINIIALRSGFQIGYFPELCLQHIIDERRLEPLYLRRMNFSSSRSWVKLLNKHQLCAWKPISKIGLWLRYIKAFFMYKPWRNKVSAIRYAGACGIFKGLSEISEK